ncbi:PH domain-containing protein [Streptomyces sp. ME02-8801-2C]|uniref:PH domain-containing protein n=1 Tax=Streptomyces sp. ME02-8801-2C TaxID=3028680 RepID=UPI0029ACD0CA|nr:PH domain-containing protein [Streptomyces sp. ME02-8801-2C]MDX3456846.1 PH domain-containing protein [Streptomyces sp. ME02-8801-2C]
MTTPDHPSPSQGPTPPESPDRVFRSPSSLVAGVLLLGLAGWLGGDALIVGHGRTPWLALATLLLVVPLVIAFTLRPAVFANDHRLRVRNPFRVVVAPWGAVEGFRSGFSNEVVVESGAKYQLWAVPVSLRARKRANRAKMREAREAGGGGGRMPLIPPGPTRAQNDQIMDDLGHLWEAREKAATSQGEVTVKWSYEIMAPAAAGAVLLAILLAVG